MSPPKPRALSVPGLLGKIMQPDGDHDDDQHEGDQAGNQTLSRNWLGKLVHWPLMEFDVPSLLVSLTDADAIPARVPPEIENGMVKRN